MTPAEQIADNIARRHGLRLEDLRSPDRRAPLVAIRYSAMNAVRAVRRTTGEPRYSTTFIGRLFCRDHTTVLHAFGVADRRRQEGCDRVAAILAKEWDLMAWRRFGERAPKGRSRACI